MKAARLVGPRQFEILDVDTPSPKPGEALVKLETLSICGSDLLTYDRVFAEEDYPRPAGLPCHETSGVVVESLDESLKPGERVVALTYSGGLFEYVAMPAARCIPVPESVPAHLAVLAQPVGTVIYAVQKMGSVLGRSVVILGQGPIGLSFTDLLARAGASKLIVTDVVDYRLDLAKKIGATHTVNAARENVIEAVKEITKGEFVDFSVEACGLPETCNQACNVLKMHGTTVIFGMPHGGPVFPFDWGGMYYKLPTILVTNSARAGEVADNVKVAVDLMAQGRIDPSFMVSHKVPFSEVGRAYELFSRRVEGAVKVLITL